MASNRTPRRWTPEDHETLEKRDEYLDKEPERQVALKAQNKKLDAQLYAAVKQLKIDIEWIVDECAIDLKEATLSHIALLRTKITRTTEKYSKLQDINKQILRFKLPGTEEEPEMTPRACRKKVGHEGIDIAATSAV
ncbi:hypothetical protein IMSHALPRED_002296 [Imshaugia aleurites]|uniref:Uncharacterized protein n=1 Tax=Imshaugia aleurites TaxID=172621 RepID=A0A8H3EYS3_9LECA|nr:hypothetical protein IMSHALPRED_002296 [Imshaugia aleurites]